MFQREGVRVVHTVRRTLRGVEQERAGRLLGARAARIPGPGVTSGATPGRSGSTSTRIPRSVPEAEADSGP
ncbi:hypothetical protein DEJ44_20165 [Streptomyces venezuelae]|nr:hypothetical protein DEJ43_21210 [Streptomyces venezuelae ATCC 10712]QES07689.1 hypothetical protein DEJ44_20165 [Streptomyces venezuelae]QES13637.1 hypothetical protein DEJ45_15250 [Streptomyces venezuelae]